MNLLNKLLLLTEAQTYKDVIVPNQNQNNFKAFLLLALVFPSRAKFTKNTTKHCESRGLSEPLRDSGNAV